MMGTIQLSIRSIPHELAINDPKGQEFWSGPKGCYLVENWAHERQLRVHTLP